MPFRRLKDDALLVDKSYFEVRHGEKFVLPSNHTALLANLAPLETTLSLILILRLVPPFSSSISLFNQSVLQHFTVLITYHLDHYLIAAVSRGALSTLAAKV